MLIDLHVHSHHTRGCTLAPRDVVRRAKEAGLDGVAFTDLNTLDGLEEIRAAGREEGLPRAVRASRSRPTAATTCASSPTPPRSPRRRRCSARRRRGRCGEVLAKVKELGGVAVAAHPYDKTIDRPSGDFIFTLDGLSAIEGLNARRKGPANDLAVEAADHMNLPCTGASGALDAADEIGKAATLFRDPVATEADLVAQLRAGTVFCVAIGVTPGAAEPGRERGADRRGPRAARSSRSPGRRR